MQVGGDRGQHEAEDQQIEAVHRVAEHRRDERAHGVAIGAEAAVTVEEEAESSEQPHACGMGARA